ncbi:hypothetical protein J7E93_30560 [Streptomyces sp. ISL-36]|uniref:hypothetical protein n=1 Tax=Streptomyces sp. ISL-36 TaxID=2819182 RepID=UPI001BEA766D|nr:hypothetical protein [Streptomyces sp. ISL-36]MBT2444361.1 hypothetical protein [Streptomyces sp. ISL-36]
MTATAPADRASRSRRLVIDIQHPFAPRPVERQEALLVTTLREVVASADRTVTQTTSVHDSDAKADTLLPTDRSRAVAGLLNLLKKASYAIARQTPQDWNTAGRMYHHRIRRASATALTQPEISAHGK